MDPRFSSPYHPESRFNGVLPDDVDHGQFRDSDKERGGQSIRTHDTVRKATDPTGYRPHGLSGPCLDLPGVAHAFQGKSESRLC